MFIYLISLAIVALLVGWGIVTAPTDKELWGKELED